MGTVFATRDLLAEQTPKGGVEVWAYNNSGPLFSQRHFQYLALAHVTYVIGSVHLDLKSIRIIELERFF